MGSVVSQAANGIGGVVGNAFAVPIKTLFGVSCEDVCSGPWDLICFIEHLCVSDLLKLLMIFALSYLTLMFFYLLFKVGICQCIGKSLCKICWAGCEAYWFALEDITCFLWHKLKNTKRVNRRRRFRDIEAGYTSSSESDSSEDYHHLGRKNKSGMERRRTRSRSWRSLHPSSRFGSRNNHHRHHVRLKTREISVHVKGGSRRPRNSRQLQLRLRNPRRNMGMFKRKRLG
ncbi:TRANSMEMBRANE PROTEIN [Salix purpurea]|uniref:TRANSMEMBRANE PROTEIN n=1 Tax=Salix purpurea TaxID=77065 RepID=A0A9Q0V142_SALPP|nr:TRANSMEMBRANE PROTEIN [Salix purpurea]